MKGCFSCSKKVELEGSKFCPFCGQSLMEISDKTGVKLVAKQVDLFGGEVEITESPEREDMIADRLYEFLPEYPEIQHSSLLATLIYWLRHDGLGIVLEGKTNEFARKFLVEGTNPESIPRSRRRMLEDKFGIPPGSKDRESHDKDHKFRQYLADKYFPDKGG